MRYPSRMRALVTPRLFALRAVTAISVTLLAAGHGWGEQAQSDVKPFEPRVGQAGKDVVWVPSPPSVVEKMLDMAQVAKDDLVMDLGSGDGRNVIAAAKRGARAIGVEFNADMVRLSRQLATEAGVGDRATFVEGDMYAADISKATVMALFLLPTNLERLRDKLLNLAPGTRIVLNTLAIPEWEPDERAVVTTDCTSWCNALLYYVPARVDGRWTTTRGELVLTQRFQMVTGTLDANGTTTPVNGRLRGRELEMSAGSDTLRGTVTRDRIEGPLAGQRMPAR